MNKHQAIRQIPLPRQPQIQQQTFQVDLKDATKAVCSCGSDIFIQAIQIYTVSPIVSPNGQELFAPQPIFICQKCSEPYKKSQ
jgi:hypothetical protein